MEDLLKEYRDVSLKKINKEIYRVKREIVVLEKSLSKSSKYDKTFSEKKKLIEENRYRLYLLFGMQYDLLFTIHYMKCGYPPDKKG